MNRFTIEPDFIEFASAENNTYLFTDVLVVFAQDNEFKLCIDSSQIALDNYWRIAKKSEMLRTWFGLINAKGCRYIEFIEISNQIYKNEKELYIDICSKTFCEKKRLIVKRKQPYNVFSEKIQENKIQLIDGDEAKEALNRRIVQISFGDNSSNVIGDHNTI